MQYPGITVCMYREEELQDQIEEMQAFPAKPRGDLIARYFYHYSTSNGLDWLDHSCSCRAGEY